MTNKLKIENILNSLTSQEDIKKFMHHSENMHMTLSRRAILSFHQPFLNYMLTCEQKYLHFSGLVEGSYLSDKLKQSFTYLIQNDFFSKNQLRNLYTQALISNNKTLCDIIQTHTTYNDITFFINNEKTLFKILNLPENEVREITEHLTEHKLFLIDNLLLAIENRAAYVVQKIIEGNSLEELNAFVLKNKKEISIFLSQIPGQRQKAETLIELFYVLLMNEYSNFEIVYTSGKASKSFALFRMFFASIEKIHDKNNLTVSEKRYIEYIITYSPFKLTPLFNKLKDLDYLLPETCLRNYIINKNSHAENYEDILALSIPHLNDKNFIKELYNGTLNFFRHEHFTMLNELGFSYKEDGNDFFYENFFKRLNRAQFTRMRQDNKENFLTYLNTVLQTFIANNFKNEECIYLCENVHKIKKPHLLSIQIFFEKNILLQRVNKVDADNQNSPVRRI